MAEPVRFERHASGAISLIECGTGFEDRLRKYFDYVRGQSAYYRGLMDQCGISPRTSPLDLLGAMPITDKQTYRDVLQMEALSSIGGNTFVTDFSSGSTAKPVVRVCRAADDLCEQEVTETVFRRAGMGPGDRFVCMDVGAAEIYDFYTRAARNLGATQAFYLHLTSHWQRSVMPLKVLRPTILLTVPSLLARIWDHVSDFWSAQDCPVRIVFSMGEPMHPTHRSIVQTAWDCRVVSFYGTTEVGGFAGECPVGDGHHFDPGLVIPTIQDPHLVDGQSVEGELYLTTTHVHTQSVIKYRVGDFVRLSISPCACGDPTPRLWFLRRREDAFVMAGEKFNHSTFLEAFRERLPDLQVMTLEIEAEPDASGLAVLRFILPETAASQQAALLEILTEGIFELDSLYRYGLVRFEFCFQPPASFAGRKIPRVIDRRRFAVH